jgi:hypothetical protein
LLCNRFNTVRPFVRSLPFNGNAEEVHTLEIRERPAVHHVEIMHSWNSQAQYSSLLPSESLGLAAVLDYTTMS